MIIKFVSAFLISFCLISNLAADNLLIPIKSGNDDAEERQNTSMYLESTDLELTTEFNSQTQESTVQTIGLRFTNVQIPAGAQIDNAYVQFKVDETSNGESSLTIAGEAVADAAPFSEATANISSRPLTANQVNWSPPPWPTVGVRGLAQRTPDLSSILQEMIDSDNWASGQAVALIINGSGRRVAESFEGDAAGAARLHVQFSDPSDPEPQTERLKVAFTGDQGVGSGAQNVLSLIAAENTDLLLLQGDLGYAQFTAQQWETNLNDYLGENFPVLTVVGNHENYEWDTYQSFISDRINRVPGLSNCTGEPGVKSFCQYQNLDIVQVAPGISHTGIDPDDNYAEFIAESFGSAPVAQGNRWRICSWHKNQTKMQTGNKPNDVGWEAYDACLQVGAIVATAHEHAYSRTHLLDNFETQSIVHTDSVMTLEPGQSFAFVSGLGGNSIRSQQRGGDWWASIYTSTQGATDGALFCEFGDTDADCYFKNVDGLVVDQFTLELPGSELDLDTDRDGVADINDSFPLDPDETLDTDGDLIGNNADEDDDGDGVNDIDDSFPLDPSETMDSDGDGIGDNADPDTVAPVSNSALRIILDGQLDDWSSYTSFGMDADDVSGVSDPLDWREGWMAHDANFLYIAWSNDGPVSRSWGQSIFMDTDSNSATGFKDRFAMGAEYILQAEYLYRYIGDGTSWQWEFVSRVATAFSASNAEIRINQTDIASPPSLRAVFVGINAAYGGTELDLYPDGAFSSDSTPRYFEYSAPRPANTGPLAQNQTLTGPINEQLAFELAGSDADNDALTYQIVGGPANGTVSGTAPELIYIPDNDYAGPDSLTFTVSDGNIVSNVATIDFNIEENTESPSVSNQAGDIIIDGELTDWSEYTSFGTDADDVSGDDILIDWEEAWIAHDEDNFYLAFLEHDNNPSSPQEWRYNTYIDTDRDSESGYAAGQTAIGADFLLQGPWLYRHNSTNPNAWSWIAVGKVSRVNSSGKTEIAFDRQWLDNATDFNVVFVANNTSIGATTNDFYPDGIYDATESVRFFTYSTDGP